MRALAVTLAIMIVAGCGGEQDSGSAPAQGTRTAIDETARVHYELSGTHLRVEVLPDAPRFEDLFLGRGNFTFGCGTDPYGSISRPDAEGTASFSPETRAAEVELSTDVAADVVLCTAQAPGGAVESAAWFVDPEELYGFNQPTEEEQAANEARAKAATDCVAFINEIRVELGIGRDRELLYPGAPPTVPVKAYWFGSRLDERRAVYAHSSMQVDYAEEEQTVEVPMHTVVYQLPQDGCQSGALEFSSDEDFGFGMGHEISLTNMPATAPTAQLYLHDPEGPLAAAESFQARLSNGEHVTVYVNGGLGFSVLTDTTLVLMPDGSSGQEA
jgi:hypothetical protein